MNEMNKNKWSKMNKMNINEQNATKCNKCNKMNNERFFNEWYPYSRVYLSNIDILIDIWYSTLKTTVDAWKWNWIIRIEDLEFPSV